MARLYADEDFPKPVVVWLRKLGYDVLTVQEAGRGGKGRLDHEVLADAVADGRAVLTHNHLHYKRLHAHHQPHAGIISCTRDDEDFNGLAERIDAAIKAVGDLTNQFVRVVRPNIV
jgi:predicted nuclease of predicted toxin-antitoxin system